MYFACADPEGGSRPPPPLWDFSEVGSCVDIWWVWEGVRGVFFLSYFYFFLARSARQYSKHCKYLKNPNHFQVQRVIPSLVIHTIHGFMKVLFPCLFCLKLHDFTPFQPKIFLGRTPIPPSPLWHHLHILQS